MRKLPQERTVNRNPYGISWDLESRRTRRRGQRETRRMAARAGHQRGDPQKLVAMVRSTTEPTGPSSQLVVGERLVGYPRESERSQEGHVLTKMHPYRHLLSCVAVELPVVTKTKRMTEDANWFPLEQDQEPDALSKLDSQGFNAERGH